MAGERPVPREMLKLEDALLSSYELTRKVRLNDPKRLQALYSSRFYDAPERDRLREFCALAARLLHAPISQVNLITGDKQIVVAAYGPAVEGVEQDLTWSYCQHVIGQERTMTVDDSTQHRLVCYSLATTHGGIRSYLGVPLVTADEYVIGTFCVADHVTRQWAAQDVVILTQLANTIVAFHENTVRAGPTGVEGA